MKHSCHWKSCQKKKGWLVSEDTCQPANHISKRETVPNATSLIYQTCQHFTSAWLEKCPIYWWSLQRGIHYVRSLAVEKICTTVLHPDSEYSCLGFEFPSWTPNIDLRYSLHFLVRIFLQKYWYCSRTMNPSTHQSTARIIWMPKKNRRFLAIIKFPLPVQSLSLQPRLQHLWRYLKAEKAKHFSLGALRKTDQRYCGLSGFAAWTFGVSSRSRCH